MFEKDSEFLNILIKKSFSYKTNIVTYLLTVAIVKQMQKLGLLATKYAVVAEKLCMHIY